jgi:hypothetical protein
MYIVFGKSCPAAVFGRAFYKRLEVACDGPRLQAAYSVKPATVFESL